MDEQKLLAAATHWRRMHEHMCICEARVALVREMTDLTDAFYEG